MDFKTLEELAKLIAYLKRENDQLKQEVEDLKSKLKPTSEHRLISEGRPNEC